MDFASIHDAVYYQVYDLSVKMLLLQSTNCQLYVAATRELFDPQMCQLNHLHSFVECAIDAI